MHRLENDRRRHPRHELKRPCRVLDERTGKFLRGTTCNYAQGGLLISIHLPCHLSPGDAVRIGIAMVPLQGFMLAREMFDATIVRALGTPSGETMVAVQCAGALAPLHTTKAVAA